jgi:dolichol-phosphate mannosyltransferase
MRLSVVVPVFNEQPNLEELHRRLSAVVGPLVDQGEVDEYELVFIDDGSRDRTAAILEELAQADPAVHYISFSRNFGHEIASTAGLDHADGDAVILMDGDLQDPPELIPDLLSRWREGYDVVYAVRKKRQRETWFKRLSAAAFYRLMRKVAAIELPVDTGDFRLMDKKVVAAFREFHERHRLVRGLVAWMGFRQTGVLYDRPGRYAGETKYNVIKLIGLAIDAVSAFSTLPLRLASLVGFMTVFFAAIGAMVIVCQKLFFALDIQGYAFTNVAMLFLGGVQLLILGILGEYLGKVYRETQRRPLYLIGTKRGWDDVPRVQHAAR